MAYRKIKRTREKLERMRHGWSRALAGLRKSLPRVGAA